MCISAYRRAARAEEFWRPMVSKRDGVSLWTTHWTQRTCAQTTYGRVRRVGDFAARRFDALQSCAMLRQRRWRHRMHLSPATRAPLSCWVEEQSMPALGSPPLQILLPPTNVAYYIPQTSGAMATTHTWQGSTLPHRLYCTASTLPWLTAWTEGGHLPLPGRTPLARRARRVLPGVLAPRVNVELIATTALCLTAPLRAARASIIFS